jgi:hypothetical protein
MKSSDFITPLVGALVCYLLAEAEYAQFLYYHHGDGMNALYLMTRELLQGHTHWRLDQSRVLGPLLIAAFENYGHLTYEVAYNNVIQLSFFIANFTALMLVRSVGLNYLKCFLCVAGFASVQTLFFHYWWAPWTNIEEILVLAMFGVGLASLTRGQSLLAYAIIYVLWTFTKETFVLLPLWILFSALSTTWFSGSATTFFGILRKNATLSGICALMLVVSEGIIMVIRKLLWQSSVLSDVGLDNRPGEILHQQVQVMSNLNYLGVSIDALVGKAPPPDWPVGGLLYLVSVIAFIVAFFWAIKIRHKECLAVAGVGLVFVMIAFGFVNLPESDALLPVVPIFLSLGAAYIKSEPNSKMIGLTSYRDVHLC